MLVDLKDYNRDLDFMYYLIVRGITKAGGASCLGKFDSSALEVKCTINGVDIDIEDVLSKLQERMVANVEAARNQGVRAGLDKLADMVVAELQEEI